MNNKLKKWLIAAATGFLLSLFFHLFIGEFFVYKKKNMLYSIKPTNLLFINKIERKIEFGNMLAYKRNNVIYISRCAGFSGDSIILFKAACMNKHKNIEHNLKRSFLYEILSAVDLSDSLKNTQFEFDANFYHGIYHYFTILPLSQANSLSRWKKILEMKRINTSFDKESANIDFSKLFYEPGNSKNGIWLINDYRNNREDSRKFGFIKRKNVLGCVHVIF